MSKPRGGARPGAGRKPGVQNRITQELKAQIEEAAKDGVSPLQVITLFMRECWERAQIVDEKGKPALDMQIAKEAVVAANMAAPYVHPKVSPIEAPTPPPPPDGKTNALEDARRLAFVITQGIRERSKQSALPKPKKRTKA